jgi:hypothetical protein
MSDASSDPRDPGVPEPGTVGRGLRDLGTAGSQSTASVRRRTRAR